MELGTRVMFAGEEWTVCEPHPDLVQWTGRLVAITQPGRHVPVHVIATYLEEVPC